MKPKRADLSTVTIAMFILSILDNRKAYTFNSYNSFYQDKSTYAVPNEQVPNLIKSISRLNAIKCNINPIKYDIN